MVISTSDACNRGKFDDKVAKRRHFSINDVTKYTASGNSCDVTMGTKKTFQDREHMNLLCSAAICRRANMISLVSKPSTTYIQYSA